MNSIIVKNPSVQTAETGVIHGRFQILHNDHVKYLLAGKQFCRHLVVGITNSDPTLSKKEPEDSQRDSPLSNPLTYYERYILVNEALQADGVTPAEFSVVPFPISMPGLYKYYVPLDALFFLTIYDDWGRKKLSIFNSLGLKTHVLWEVPPSKKGISAAEIRRLMVDEKPWEHMVPPRVSHFLKKWDIPRRIKEIIEKSA
ncbi:MAG: nicotinate-nucleotide adenylyltransferase [Desulfobacterales bacterium]